MHDSTATEFFDSLGADLIDAVARHARSTGEKEATVVEVLADHDALFLALMSEDPALALYIFCDDGTLKRAGAAVVGAALARLGEKPVSA